MRNSFHQNEPYRTLERCPYCHGDKSPGWSLPVTNYNRHMKLVHANQNPALAKYPCPNCDGLFVTELARKKHARLIHRVEIPWQGTSEFISKMEYDDSDRSCTPSGVKKRFGSGGSAAESVPKKPKYERVSRAPTVAFVQVYEPIGLYCHWCKKECKSMQDRRKHDFFVHRMDSPSDVAGKCEVCQGSGSSKNF